MSVQGIGSHTSFAHLQSNLSTQHATKQANAHHDGDGDTDHGAVDSNDGGSKGQHINVTA